MGDTDIKSVGLRPRHSSLNLAVYPIRRFFQEWDSAEFSAPHRIRFNALIYISQGEGEHYVDYTLHRLKAGTLLFLSKYQVHCFEARPDLDGYIVSFDDDLLTLGEQDPLAGEIHSACMALSSMEVESCGVAPLFRQLLEEFELGEDEFNGEILRCLLRALLLKSLVRRYRSLSREGIAPGDDESFRQLVDLIEAHFRQSRSVSEYAERMCRSVKQVNKLARDHSGSTAKQLIDARVVLELKRLLGYSNLAISTIAVETGFAEATNMTKFFRHHTEMTPSEYRNLCRSSAANRTG